MELKSRLAYSVVCVVIFAHTSLSKAVLKNNGYEDVVVAIGNTVPPDDSRFLAAIPALMQKTSKALFEATNNRAYMRKVTIVFPSEWKAVTGAVEPEPGESFREADIRFDHPTPGADERPYTRTATDCAGGMFIHIDRGLVTNSEAQFSAKFGPSGKALAHEWAHYRWGLKDEYGKGFYLDTDGKYHPVGCTADIPGQVHNKKTRAKCRLNPDTKHPEEDCFFEINPFLTTVTGSFMYKQFVSKITKFCDDTTPGSKHNVKAPNNQNERCGYRSNWKIMEAHEDFSGGKNQPAANPASVNTKPVFRIVQPKKTVDAQFASKICLLFDISSAMAADNYRLHYMVVQAADNFIRNLVIEGSYVGVVFYGKGITIKTKTSPKMVEVNAAGRATLLGLLPKTTDIQGPQFDTADIFGGMKHCVEEVLNKFKPSTTFEKGSSVVLMSSGLFTGAETLLDGALPDYKKRGITVYTIGLDAASDTAVLKRIADDTGGMFFHYSGSQTSPVLHTAFARIADVTAPHAKEPTRPVLIHATGGRVVKTFGKTLTFQVDPSIGKDLTLHLSYSVAATAHLVVAGDKWYGSVHTPSSYYRDTTRRVEEITVPGIAKVGLWQLVLTSSVENDVTLVIQAKTVRPGRNGEAIRVKTFYEKGSRVGPASTDFATLYAEVARLYAHVIGLRLTAIVEGKKGSPTTKLSMHDDGLVTDTHLPIVIPLYVPIGSGRPLNTNLQLMSGVDALIIEAPTSGTVVDVIPPPRIKDLTLHKIDIEKKRLILNWTSPGDVGSTDKTPYYDLSIQKSFEYARLFKDPERLKDMPKPRGETEQITATLSDPKYKKTDILFLTVRAVDASGNKGPHSNILAVSFTVPTKFSTGDEIDQGSGGTPGTTTTAPTTTASSSANVPMFSLYLVIVLTVCTVLTLL